MKRVRVVAIKRAFETAPVDVQPHFEEATKTFWVGEQSFEAKASTVNGQTIYLAQGAPVPFDSTDSFKFNHNDGFDLDVPVDVFMLDILKNSKFCATSRDSVNPVEHRFYIDDPTETAKINVGRAERIGRALAELGKMNGSDKRDLSFVLGLPVVTDQLSSDQIDGLLSEIAVKDPDKLNSVFSNRDFKYHAFLGKLVSFGILSINAGQYRSGDTVIAIDRAAMVAFLRDKTNQGIIKQWNQRLLSKSENDTVLEEPAAPNT